MMKNYLKTRFIWQFIGIVEWSCAPLCLVCGGSAMIRFLILAGYFELTMYLQLSGKLNQYINLHYSYLAYISMFLSFVLALVQLIIWVKQMKIHSHLSSFWAKVASIFLLCIPLFVGLFFPTVTLDSQTVSAKGYHFRLLLVLPRKSSRTKEQLPSISNQILVAILPSQPMSQK